METTKDKVLKIIRKICLRDKKSPLQVTEELLKKIEEAKKK